MSSRSVRKGLFVLFVSAVSLAALAGPLSAQELDQVDPFYKKLLEDGKAAFAKGQFAAAVENLDVAFFGFLDYPVPLLDCYLHLEIGYFNLKNEERARYYRGEIKKRGLEPYLNDASISDAVRARHAEIDAAFTRVESRGTKPPADKKPAAKTEPEAAATRPDQAQAAPGAKPAPPDEEIKSLKAALKSDPKNAEAAFRLSALYADRMKIKDARGVLDEFLKRSDKNAEAHYRLGLLWLAEKKSKNAQDAFIKSASLGFSGIDLFYQLGRLYLEQKDPAKAKTEFDKVRAIDPGYKDLAVLSPAPPEEAVPEPPLSAEEALVRARAETDPEKQIPLYRRVIRESRGQVDVYLELYGAYTSAHRYAEAAALMEELRADVPNDSRIPLRIGQAWLADKSFAKAAEILTAALKFDPDNLDIRYLLGRAHMGMKKFRDAVAEFDVILERQPVYKDAADLRRRCLENIKTP